MVEWNAEMEYWNGIRAGATTTVTGGVHVNSNIWLPHKPSLLLYYSSASPYSSVSPDTNPFTLTVVAGNISVCRGCKQHYVKPVIPPWTYVFVIKNGKTSLTLQDTPNSVLHGNVYYHCNTPCIVARCPTFPPRICRLIQRWAPLLQLT